MQGLFTETTLASLLNCGFDYYPNIFMISHESRLIYHVHDASSNKITNVTIQYSRKELDSMTVLSFGIMDESSYQAGLSSCPTITVQLLCHKLWLPIGIELLPRLFDCATFNAELKHWHKCDKIKNNTYPYIKLWIVRYSLGYKFLRIGAYQFWYGQWGF